MLYINININIINIKKNVFPKTFVKKNRLREKKQKTSNIFFQILFQADKNFEFTFNKFVSLNKDFKKNVVYFLFFFTKV